MYILNTVVCVWGVHVRMQACVRAGVCVCMCKRVRVCLYKPIYANIGLLFLKPLLESPILYIRRNRNTNKIVTEWGLVMCVHHDLQLLYVNIIKHDTVQQHISTCMYIPTDGSITG